MKKAFSLLELMVVMGIILMLAALLMPAFSKVRSNFKKVETQRRMHTLEFAIRRYHNEYGKLPSYNNGTIPTNIFTIAEQQNLINMLNGNNCDLAGNAGGNPKQIRFLDFNTKEFRTVAPVRVDGVNKAQSGSTVTNYVDAWGNAIIVSISQRGYYTAFMPTNAPNVHMEGDIGIMSGGENQQYSDFETNVVYNGNIWVLQSITQSNNFDNLISNN